MGMTTQTRRGLAPGVMVAGGVLLAVGSLLQFATVDVAGFGSQSVSGLDTDDGKLFLGVGIAAIILGAIAFRVSGGVRRVLAALVTLAAGFMTYAAIIDLTGLEDEVPAEFAGQITVSAGIGLYLVLGGAIIATIGGLLGLFGTSAQALAPMAPPPPPAPQPPPVTPPQ